MSLQLFEIVPVRADREAAGAVVSQVTKAVEAAGSRIVESQVTADHRRIFAVVDAESPEVLEKLRASVTATGLAGTAQQVLGPDEVRLVGTEADPHKTTASRADYLVEWDLPSELDMDSYLTRKKAAAPRYSEVPEVQFLRTYVREDMGKCLCLYDSPDEECVRAARKAVDTPIDRLHALAPTETEG